MQYTYAGTSTSNSVRRTGILGDSPVDYDYGSAGGINDRLSRIQKVIDANDAGCVAEYTY